MDRVTVESCMLSQLFDEVAQNKLRILIIAKVRNDGDAAIAWSSQSASLLEHIRLCEEAKEEIRASWGRSSDTDSNPFGDPFRYDDPVLSGKSYIDPNKINYR